MTRATVHRTEGVIYGRKHGMALTLDVFQPAAFRRVGGNGCGLAVPGQRGLAVEQSDAVDGDDSAGGLSAVSAARVYGVRGRDEFAAEVCDTGNCGGRAPGRAVCAGECGDVRSTSESARHLGSGSGGHLVLSIATQGGAGPADAKDPVERESSAVQAAACFFPPTDFLNYGRPGICGVGAGPLAPLGAAFGPRALDPKERLSLGREISPIYFVTAQLPPP